MKDLYVHVSLGPSIYQPAPPSCSLLACPHYGQPKMTETVKSFGFGACHGVLAYKTGDAPSIMLSSHLKELPESYSFAESLGSPN